MRFRALLFTLMMAGCASSEHDAAVEGAVSDRARPAETTPDSGGSEMRGLSVTYTAAYGTREFTIHATLDQARTSVHVEGFEFIDSSSGERESYEWDMTEPTDGVVVERIVMRDTNDWYLACRSINGQVDIERWVLERTDGAYYCERPTSTRGVGEPLTTPQREVRIENQRYLPPAQRPRPPFTKTVILRGLTLDPIETMMVDPDARYLLLQTNSAWGDSRLIQLALMASASRRLAVGDMVTLLDSSTNPVIGNSVSLAFLEHPQRGRVILVSDASRDELLWDQENDGVFEYREEMDSAERHVAYPFECWSRSF